MPTATSHSPARVQRFVGREKDLSTLIRQVADGQYTIVSIVGPAGVGKTRLARELADVFPSDNQSIFVALDGVNCETSVADHVVAACGVTPIGRDDVGRMMRRLEAREDVTLIVLDNAEHLSDGVRQIAEHLASLRQIRVVVTSRSPLDLKQEQLYPLATLSVEDGAYLLQSIARERGVEISSVEALQLSQSLDGLPLAIELAAERTTILSPHQIDTRVRESNRVLSSQGKNRHASLDLAFNSAWVHLSEPQRALCVQLARFSEALDPEIVGEIWHGTETIQLGHELVARSWLSSTGAPQRAWHMLRPVRTFALEQANQLDQVEFDERVMTWAQSNLDKDRTWWIRRVTEGTMAFDIFRQRRLHEQAGTLLQSLLTAAAYGKRVGPLLRTATVYFHEVVLSENHAVASALATWISRFSMLYQCTGSATEWSQRALDLAHSSEARLHALAQHARALFDEARMAEAIDASEAAYRAFQEGAVVTKSGSDRATWLIDLASVLSSCGNVHAALSIIEDALDIPDVDAVTRARCFLHLASISYDCGRMTTSERALDEAVELLVDAGPDHILTLTTPQRACLHIVRGELDEADANLDRAFASAKQSENRGALFYCYRTRAELEMARGRNARPFLEKAYYELAIPDDNAIAIEELRVWLTLQLIYEGEYSDAIAQLDLLLGAEEANQHARSQSATNSRRLNMLRASRLFCTLMIDSRKSVPEDTPFGQVVNLAFRAFESHSIEAFDAGCRSLDLSNLVVPGIALFRFERHVRAWILTAFKREARRTLRVENSGITFEFDGSRYNFSRKGVLRKILMLLIQQSRQNPGRPLDIDAIIRHVWPADQSTRKISRHRAYSAMNRLRSTGNIGDYVLTTDRGYLLSPDLKIHWEEGLG